MDEEEKKKIKKLVQEKQKDAGAIEWMYKGDKPEADDYLLGKRVDRYVEQEEEKKPEDDIGAIFGDRIKANLALDMQAKAREDPLFAIRKREEDMRRQLLQNPVKMKRLQKTIAERQKKDKKKESKHRKDGSDSDDDIMKKYLSILNKKHQSDSTEKHKKKSKEKKFRSHDHDIEDSDYDVKHKHDSDHHRKHKSDSDDRLRGDIDHGHKHRKDFDHSHRHKHRSESDHYKKYTKKPEHSYKSKHKKDSDSSDSERDYYYKQKHKLSHDSDHKSNRNHSKNVKHRDQSVSDVERNSKKRKHYDKLRYDSDETSEGSSEELMKAQVENFQESRRRRADTSDEEDGGIQRKAYGLIKGKITKKSQEQYSERNRSRSPRRKSESPKLKTQSSEKSGSSRNRSKSPRRRSRSPRRRSRSPRRRSISPRRRSRSPKAPSKMGKPRKLTAEEKQQKLQDMMANAKWRDEQRTSNINRYAEEQKKEAEQEQRNKGASADFVNPMMASHASKSSLQDRLKRNRYNIQRTKADLNKDSFKK